MRKKHAGLALIATFAILGLGGIPRMLAQGPPPPPPPPPPPFHDHDHDHGDWDAPPGEYHEVERRGFHDGIEGARKDFGNHRRPDVNNRDEYRHPDVPRHDREAYRVAFERGYNVGVEHIYAGRSF